MTALTDRPGDSLRVWVVDLATRRVVRRAGSSRAHAAPPPAALRKGYAGSSRHDGDGGVDAMSIKDLNPLEDLKGARKLIEEAHPLKALKEALTEAAEYLDPAQSDVRAVEPEPDAGSEIEEPGAHGKTRHPSGAHPWPDQKELGKEHRG